MDKDQGSDVVLRDGAPHDGQLTSPMPTKPALPALDREPLAGLLDRKAGETGEVLTAMRARLDQGRAEIERYFASGGEPEIVHRDLAIVVDDVLRGGLEWADRHLFGSANPTTGERLAVIAVGGYGRAELAPGSDIDILFLHPYKRSPYVEQMVEFLVYRLWDLGLKVGQATRSLAECLKLAKEDLSVQTAILEARLLWGDEALFAQLQQQFQKEIVEGGGAAFIEAKLAERNQRHQRLGDSRFLLEPNVKEGKGGLRDLQTLMWIARFLYQVREPEELVAHAVLTPRTLRIFQRSRRFLWAVRCHLHYLTGRPEERLTFDLQPAIAARLGFRDRGRLRGVERFMKYYYLVARDVGALTRVVCAALEDQLKRKPRFGLQRFGFGRRRLNGFEVQGNRVNLVEPDLFEGRPIAMLELFQLSQQRELDVHPRALQALTDNLSRVDRQLRQDPEANRLFLEMLCSRQDPAMTLTRMNDVGLLGRFLPEFGRVVGQMQHNLYHIYTVDEHTIRAIGILAQIERKELGGELPLATEIMPKLQSRQELYLATLLHDIGKGRDGDHSEIGAAIASSVCRRLQLGEAAGDTVTWLVRYHLLMSEYAFKRDSEDPKTIQDFVAIVQSPERLKLLLVLTAADIRAVGPNVWNGWKGQLLRELYHEAASAMASGDPQGRRAERIENAKEKLALALAAERPVSWPGQDIEAYVARHDPRYWLGFPLEQQLAHARMVREADRTSSLLTVDFRSDRFRARTEVMIYAPDHPGLFMKIAGALAISGVSILDAHIFTTADGMALDLLGCQDADGQSAVEDERRLERIRANVEKALAGEIWLDQAIASRQRGPARTDVFKVEPRVLVDNSASRTLSVLEVNGRDRVGLLYELAKAIKDLGLVINSAHISTYGERVVDVFYVKDVFGLKITSKSKLARIERQLGEVLAGRPAQPRGSGGTARSEPTPSTTSRPTADHG